MQKALELGVIKERFQFRDIRRKVVREAKKKYGKDYARMLLGHTTDKTTNIYLGKGLSPNKGGTLTRFSIS